MSSPPIPAAAERSRPADSEAAEDARKIRRLLAGHIFTQILATAARLGVFDGLAEGARTSAELSAATGVPARELRRCLRALEGFELVERHGDVYRLAGSAELLSGDRGLFGHAVLAGGEYYEAWAELGHCLLTGESAFQKRFGCTLWDRLAQVPEAADAFARMMRQNTESVGARLLEVHAFPSEGIVADLGAGSGALLAELLVRMPGLRGIAVEQPSVIEHTRATLERHELQARSDLVAGDLLTSVPAGADVYILKSVIHNWRDEAAVSILRNCSAVMKPGASLLLIERVLDAEASPVNEVLNGAIQDLTMLVLFGARDRTLDDYRDLLRDAGLGIRSSADIGAGLTVIEASRAS
jgi:precorrin-6B methylase 2